MKRLYLGVLAFAGLATIALTAPANAITVSLVTNDTVNFPTSSFNIAPLLSTGTVVTLPGSVENVRRSPWQGTPGTNEATLAYTSVTGGYALYNLTGTVLTFFLGSPDTYNTLTFYTGANASGDEYSVTGSLFPATQLGHNWVTLSTNGVFFNSVKFASTSAALEYSNIVAATPIPPAMLLFLSGLGTLGWLGRRKQLTTI